MCLKSDHNETPRELIPLGAFIDPGQFGFKVCSHCNGYGSSLKDPEGVDLCTVCGGTGLVKDKAVEP